MKTLSKCLAIVLAVAGAATLAGCSKSTPNYKTATTANWNVRTSTAVEENSFEFWKSKKEVAEYAVTFSAGSNSSYEVTYDTTSATYSTAFYMKTFDWSKDTIDAYSTKESLTEDVYVYETSLSISGSYKMKSGGEIFEFSDVLETVCYFRPAGRNLQPVYSHQKVINTTPAALSTGSIGSTYVQVNEVYDTYYNRSCSHAFVQKYAPESAGSDNYVESGTESISLSSDYSNFDNSQLRAAIRAFTLSGGSSRTFYVVTPQNGNIQSVTASISDPIELNSTVTEHNDLINVLASAPEDYIFFDGAVEGENATPRNIRFNAVSLSINESLKGASPTMWYTTVENGNINSTRCVLLKMSTPLSFGLGTLNYNLKSLDIV